ncbi:hypothetical protein LUU34_00723300 [Aix galericulata]|nr:hypothetical protein LUU34_00723300 [Aix galericulata]
MTGWMLSHPNGCELQNNCDVSANQQKGNASFPRTFRVLENACSRLQAAFKSSISKVYNKERKPGVKKNDMGWEKKSKEKKMYRRAEKH